MSDSMIIFDCDGTLVDSEPIANRVFVDQLREYGVPLTDEEAWLHFPGTSLSHCMQYVTQTFQFDFPDDFIDDHRARQKIAFAESLQPITGIREALDKITMAKCVASNGPLQTIKTNLSTTGLLHHFDNLFSAHEIQKWKPQPDLFLYAANSMDRQPDRCIVIEDSMAGIAAAKSAGMKVLAFSPKNGHYQIQKGDTDWFDRMELLPELILRLMQ